MRQCCCAIPIIVLCQTWSANTHLPGWLIHTYCLAMHTVIQLRHTVLRLRQHNEDDRTVRTSELEDRILDEAAKHPRISTRRIGAAEYVAHSTVWRFFREQILYPYHQLQRVQDLCSQHYPGIAEFCQWPLQYCDSKTCL